MGCDSTIHIIHIYPTPRTLLDASLFIVSSLLISHNVRRDREAWINYRGKWIRVRGSRVRQLRPDSITAESWIKAVLYKGKGPKLGAEILETPPQGIQDPICVYNRDPLTSPTEIHSLINKTLSTHGMASFIYNNDGACSHHIYMGSHLSGWMMPAIINIIIDRIYSGLQP